MPESDRTYELISGDIDGLLDERGRAELAALLDSDPEAARLYHILSAAHSALDFEADPPARLLAGVMEGVERENAARRASRARVIRLTAGFAAAAAVLAVAIIPGTLTSGKDEAANGEMYGLSAASEAPAEPPSETPDGAAPEASSGGSAAPGEAARDLQEPATCYTPASPEDGFMLMMPGVSADVPLTVEEFCAGYYAVLYFTTLPPELTDPDPVLFSDGTAGHIITREQFDAYLDQADSVQYPDPGGALIMAVAPIEQ